MQGDAPTRPVEVRPLASNQRLAIRAPGCRSLARPSSACFSPHLSTLRNTAVMRLFIFGQKSKYVRRGAPAKAGSCSLSAPGSKQTGVLFTSTVKLFGGFGTAKKPQHPIRLGGRGAAGLAGSLQIDWDYHPITTVSRVHRDRISKEKIERK